MILGYDYIFSESKEFRNMLIAARKKGIDPYNIKKGSEFYQTFKPFKKIIEDFDSGQNLLKKIRPKYIFNGVDPIELVRSVKNYKIAKKQSNLENIFLEKGEYFTIGFLSNFHNMENIFITPFFKMIKNPFGLPNFSGIIRWKNKINYKNQYNSATKALNIIISKE